MHVIWHIPMCQTCLSLFMYKGACVYFYENGLKYKVLKECRSVSSKCSSFFMKIHSSYNKNKSFPLFKYVVIVKNFNIRLSY